jgi:hypothetical protein
LPRLFISHSNKDSIHALAFQRWLELKGWARDDVFIRAIGSKAQGDLRCGGAKRVLAEQRRQPLIP